MQNIISKNLVNNEKKKAKEWENKGVNVDVEKEKLNI